MYESNINTPNFNKELNDVVLAHITTYISYFGARTRSRATEVGFSSLWKGPGGI